MGGPLFALLVPTCYGGVSFGIESSFSTCMLRGCWDAQNEHHMLAVRKPVEQIRMLFPECLDTVGLLRRIVNPVNVLSFLQKRVYISLGNPTSLPRSG